MHLTKQMQPLIKHDIMHNIMKGELLSLKVFKIVLTMCDCENEVNNFKLLQSKQFLGFP